MDSALPRFQFIGVPGCTFNADNFAVLDYFQLFFDNELINLLVTESNHYAEQQPRRSSDVLLPTKTEEMQIFLCINIIQGILKKPEERMYWTTKDIFATPIFPKLMSLRRYLYIKKIYIFLIMNHMTVILIRILN